MAIHKSAGARLFIGPVVDTDAIEAMSEAAAITFWEAIIEGDWEEVEEVESVGEVGDNTEVATFASLSKRRVRKLKTVRDAGTMQVIVGRDALDPGQMALIAAEKTDFNYAFKIEYADARTEAHSDSVEYFGGMVLSRPTNIASARDVTKRTFNVGVNTAIYAVDTAVTPP